MTQMLSHSEQMKARVTARQALEVLNAVGDGITRNGIRVEFDGDAKTAFTDGQRIILPTPPFEMSKADWRKLNGYIDHECSHVLWTAMERHKAWIERMNEAKQGTKAKAIHAIFNVIEDARINRRAIREWPGAKSNLGATYEAVLGDKIDDPKEFCHEGTIGVLNGMHAKLEGYEIPDYFDADTRRLAERCFDAAYPAVMDNVMSSPDDAYVAIGTVSKAIYKALKQAQEGNQPPQGGGSEPQQGEEGEEGQGEGQQGEGQDSSGSGDLGDLDDRQEGEGEGGTKAQPDGDEQGQGEGGGSPGETEESGSGGGKGGDGVGHSASKVEGDLIEAGAKMEEDMQSTLPKSSESMGARRGWYGSEEYQMQEAANAKTAKHIKVGTGKSSRLKDLIDPPGLSPKLRRVLQAEAMSSRRGGLEDGVDLDLDRLPAFVAGAPIVDIFERKHRGKAPTVAINLVLDGSTSMNDGVRRNVQSSLAIALGHAFRRNGVKFRITVMSTAPRYGAETYGPVIIKEFEEPWSIASSPGAVHVAASPLGGTPILANMFDGIFALRKRKESRRILFIVTDGCIGGDAPIVSKWHNRMLMMGIELVFCPIDMQPDMGPDIARIDFPKDFWRLNRWNTEVVVKHIADQIPMLILKGERALMGRRH